MTSPSRGLFQSKSHSAEDGWRESVPVCVPVWWGCVAGAEAAAAAAAGGQGS